MKFKPQLIIGPDYRLLAKYFFPNVWGDHFGLIEGGLLPDGPLTNSIEKYKGEAKGRQAVEIKDRKVAVLIEPSGENLHISFELKSKKSISGRKDTLNRYQLLVEAASDVIFEIDLEGRFTYMNPAALKMAGLEAEEILGKLFTILVRPDWHEKVTDFYLEQIRTSTKSTYLEFPGVNGKGEVIWLGQKVQLLEDEEGLMGMMAVARDITGRLKTEDILKQSEEKYRGMLHGLQFGLVEVDNEERIVYVNEPMCRITGYSREELIGQVASDVLVDKSTQELIRNENSKRIEGVASVYEVKITHKDGTPVWSLISGAPILNIKGETVGSIGIHMDITQKKEEELLQRQMSKKLSARNLELRKKQNFLNGINHFVTRLLDKEDINEIAWEIAEDVIEHFGFEDCVIYILNKDRNCLEQIAAYGPKMDKNRKVANPITIALGEGIVGAVAQSGKLEVVPDTRLDDRYIVDDMMRLSELCVPIIADGEVIGIIDSEHEQADFFNKEHVETLATIAHLAASRLKNAKAKRRQLKAERELIDSERKLRTVLNSALDAVVSVDAAGLLMYKTHWARGWGYPLFLRLWICTEASLK